MKVLDIITEQFPDLDHSRIILLTEFGSWLYGTHTATSDKDYKGIFIPSQEQILLGRVPKSYHYSSGKNDSKNAAQDIDIEIYSLNYFLKLACEGQTVAIDMLHVNEGTEIIGHSNDGWSDARIWNELRDTRASFYTKNLNAFVSYARKQAAKYGIKGSRLSDCKRVVDHLEAVGCYVNGELKKLDELWESLPAGEHIHKLPPHPNDKSQQEVYQVCGKRFPRMTPAHHVILPLKKFLLNYGARAQEAAENKGIDWKAVSHALRAAHQVKEILETGDLKFPLKRAKVLREVKEGKLDYTTVVAPALEALMDWIEKLAAESSLPDKVDREAWDEWLLRTLSQFYGWRLS